MPDPISYPVWYLQADYDDDLGAKGQASAVLVTVKNSKTADIHKLLITAQHALRINKTGAWHSTFRAWPPRRGFNTRTSVKVEFFTPLNSKSDKLFDPEDFAFLEVPPGFTGSPTPSPTDEWNGSGGLSIVGYPNGDEIINIHAGIVDPVVCPSYRHSHTDEEKSIACLSDGDGKPGPGVSGGGVFKGKRLAGIYRGAFIGVGEHVFVPINRIKRWCGERGYEIVEYQQSPERSLQPEYEPLELALLASDFAKSEDRLFAVLSRHPTGEKCTSFGTREEMVRGFLSLNPAATSFAQLLFCVQMEGGGGLAPAVYECLDKLFVRNISWKALDKLIDELHGARTFELLEELDANKLTREAMDILPGAAARAETWRDPSPAQVLLGCLDRLASAPVGDGGKQPIVEFVCRCHAILRLNEPQIQAWASAIGATGVQLSAPRVQAAGGEERAVLQILISEELAGRGYLLNAYLERNDSAESLKGSPDPVEKAGLPARIVVAIDEAMVALKATGASLGYIELFLPLLLLNEPLELAERKLGRLNSQPIGQGWPVVVRSYDRLGIEEKEWYEDSYPKLASKWKLLHKSPPTVDCVPWACDSIRDKYVERFSGSLLGFKVLWPIPGCPSVPFDKFADAAIAAGLPFAIWVRNPREDLGELRKRVNELFLSHDAREWPDRIRAGRLGEPAPFTQCDGFTIFYDSPEKPRAVRDNLGQIFRKNS